MREIKFRAWDKENKRFLEDYELSECNLDRDGSIYRPDNSKPFNKYDSEPIFTLFTGLLDKNGKEIYEGDFYKRILDKENRFKKSYEWADYWLVEWLDEHACFTATYIGENTDKGMIKITPKRNRYSLLNYLEIDEIIGNIYENPELIEGATK